MSYLGKLDLRTARPVGVLSLGQTVGNLIAGGIDQAQQQAKLQSMFDTGAHSAAVQYSPQVQAYLQNAGYSPDTPITPQQLVDILTSGVNGQTASQTIATIQSNLTGFISDAENYASSHGQNDTIGRALGANSAILATYSALALTMPNFQWTYVGAFTAFQVRQQLINISNMSVAGSVVGGLVIPDGGLISQSVGDHLINTLINGQISIVKDVGSLALAYDKLGTGILSALPKGSYAYNTFRLQGMADADTAKGNRSGAAELGMEAAIQLGTKEQNDVQGMWNDLALNMSAHVMQMAGMLDPTLHTPLGNIAAPAGYTDVTQAKDRVAIAANAFQFMYNHLFSLSPSSPLFSPSWNNVDNTLRSRLPPAPTLPQVPTVLGVRLTVA